MKMKAQPKPENVKMTIKRDGNLVFTGTKPEGFVGKFTKIFKVGSKAVFATNNLGLGDCWGRIVGFNRRAIMIDSGYGMRALTPEQFINLNWGIVQ